MAMALLELKQNASWLNACQRFLTNEARDKLTFKNLADTICMIEAVKTNNTVKRVLDNLNAVKA